MELPTKVTPVQRQNPQSLIIFAKPKTGKTTAVAELTTKHGWLLLSLEPGGTDFVEAVRIDVVKMMSQEKKSVQVCIAEIGTAILKANKPYKGIIVDTVTKLEEYCLPYAADLYKQSPMGVNWVGTDVRELPKGAGYLYLRQAFFNLITYIKSLADNIIFVGHLADKLIDKKGEEVSSKELDLTGKISNILCADVDAIAYLYRKDNKTILNFTTSEDVVCGSRCLHLKNKEFCIIESDENENLTIDWSQIYLK
jgi:hypothetical protein